MELLGAASGSLLAAKAVAAASLSGAVLQPTESPRCALRVGVVEVVGNAAVRAALGDTLPPHRAAARLALEGLLEFEETVLLPAVARALAGDEQPLRAALQRLQLLLAQDRFLDGAAPGGADAALFCTLLGGVLPADTAGPVAAWHARCAALFSPALKAAGCTAATVAASIAAALPELVDGAPSAVRLLHAAPDSRAHS